MCGIIGAIAQRNVGPLLIEGLSRLEYRGYDSAGVAVLNGSIRRVRAVGRVAGMEAKAAEENLHGLVGIGHTRWATHGGVTEYNAHPHISRGEIAVVHNGIIENHDEHRKHLQSLGYVFESQTDTEVIAHLVHHHYVECGDLLLSLQRAVVELIGAYAIGVVALKSPDVMVCARVGCPLLVGLGDGENFFAHFLNGLQLCHSLGKLGLCLGVIKLGALILQLLFCLMLGFQRRRLVQILGAMGGVTQNGNGVRLNFQNTTGDIERFFFTFRVN